MEEGFCQCGCGQKTRMAPYNSKKRGWIKGVPFKYVHGHNGKIDFVQDSPLLCLCGCGEFTKRASRTYNKRGIKKGQSCKFISGHQGRVTHPSHYKGGYYIDQAGYIQIRKDGKYISRCRLVMSEKMGRQLKSEEQIHHLNGDTKDDRPENLTIVSAHEHGKIHCDHLRTNGQNKYNGIDYRIKTVNGKKQKKHRWVIEQQIGRRLTPDEFVHHINGDRNNNRIENLIIVTPSEHSIIHNQKRFLKENSYDNNRI